jgi:hypothetical protein
MITIAEVIEQCAKVCEEAYPYSVFHTDQRASKNCAAAIRALAAQYEGWIAVDTLRDTPTLDAAMDSARKYLAELDAPETCKPALQVERADARRPLTDEEMHGLYRRAGLEAYYPRDGVMQYEYERRFDDFARAIERAHKIGGNDD